MLMHHGSLTGSKKYGSSITERRISTTRVYHLESGLRESQSKIGYVGARAPVHIALGPTRLIAYNVPAIGASS